MQPDKDRIARLYGDTIEIRFNDSNHSYWTREALGGGQWSGWQRRPGSTTIIGIQDKSGALIPWAVNLARRHLKAISLERTITIYDIEEACALHTERKTEAATSGSLVHDWIESYTKGYNPPVPDQPAVLRGVNAFLEWVEKERVHIIGSETLVYSKQYGYCGQADFIFYKDGENPEDIYLGDYKTSNGLYTGVMMQTASYLRAVEEMGFADVSWTDAGWLAATDLSKVKFVGRYALRLEKRSEEEFQTEMAEKALLDVPYKAFEYVNLDPEAGLIEADFQAFLCCRGLRDWDKVAKDRLNQYRNI